ncbi:abc transporter a family member 8 [Quercus suber]|uniref:Abc transporter a family member 8 n=1 Tax=Quercus suber TaxID=58331 RepID=A0AAW0KDS0_QUESU
MADPSAGSSSFWTQANALLRKNLTYQKRNIKENIRLISFPFFLCLLLVLLQALINQQLDKPSNNCGCACIDTAGNGQCNKVCGLEYSDIDQAATCPILHPPGFPPLLQIPSPEYRAARTDFVPFTDLPDESCRSSGSCPATFLFTGNNQSLGQILAGSMIPSSLNWNASNAAESLAINVDGSYSYTQTSNFLDSAFFSGDPILNVRSQCSSNSTISVSFLVNSVTVLGEVDCVQGLHLWRNSSSVVNDELYKGYRKGNSEEKINEITAAYDFLNSNENSFNVSIWYNATYKNDSGQTPIALVRVPRLVNLASNAYLQFLRGSGTNILFESVKEMPKPGTKLRLDLSSLLGTLFFTWVILQLFPVILTSLVYEKEQRLRIMMKMHGLGDGPYWMISYAYFLSISLIYMLCFVIFGSLIGLNFFRMNDYSIQFVFYFIYVNLQISLAFLAAAMFSKVKTSAVVGYIFVFGSGLLGGFLFQFFVQDTSFPRAWIIVMELYPGFSLYRGLYEFSQASFTGNSLGTHGMRWGDLSNSVNGMKEVLIIMVVEWLVVIFAAYYIDQVVSSGSGKSPLFFLQKFRKKPPSLRNPSLQRQGSKVFVQMEKPDVSQETEKVEQLLLESNSSSAIIVDNLKKVYPGRDGNPAKFAVKGLSLAVTEGECFGMLGPNGAGKTSFISMASNAYLQFLRGSGTNILFESVKEMPKPGTKLRLDLSSLLGTLFFTWVILQLFPVILTSLVYEKEQRLRIMMKMHGLGDGPYWMISYAYFLSISLIYMLCFVIFGSLIGLNFFRMNDYSIQFVFYFIYVNLQISLAFLAAAMFSKVKTSAVVGYIFVFGSGLLGGFLFQFFVQDTSFPRAWIIVMELYPGFSLYRGLYEFSQASFTGNSLGTHGMRWGDLSNSVNGMKEVLIIMVVEWLVVIFAAYYIDQVVSSGSGKSPLFFLQKFRKKPPSLRNPSLQRQGSKVFVQMEKPDVSQEAVEESLKSVNLFNGGVGDKKAGKYSGGMKRRLSVAISLIGDPKVSFISVQSTLPHETFCGYENLLSFYLRSNSWKFCKVVYMDEPTHSMEEAEVLCDRLGIFVDGSLQCIGNPKELKARYGGSYVFTMTTSSDHEQDVDNLVRHLSPNANKIYHISGTQKFELPKHDVRIADVFQAVENAKSRFTVFAWGLADTTLEDVFIKVARGAQAFNVLS